MVGRSDAGLQAHRDRTNRHPPAVPHRANGTTGHTRLYDNPIDRTEMKPEHVLLCTDTFVDRHGDRLTSIAPGVEVIRMTDVPVPHGDLDRVTMAFMSKDTWPDRAHAFLTASMSAARLHWLHVMAAGVEGPTFDAFRDRGVIVTRTPGASASAIAETVFMYLHSLTRDVRGLAATYQDRRWEWQEWRQLEERTMIVLGYGPIGQRIIHLAHAYGMLPTVVRRSVVGDEVCNAVTVDRLPDLLPEADVIVIAVPLTAETAGLVSADVISRMKPDAIVVNVARGGIVDQTALTDALASGRLAGAGLDVFDSEPLDAADPLWDLPNVILTPHNAGSSNLGPQKVVDVFFEHLARYIVDPLHPAGQPVGPPPSDLARRS